ncbi:hypothetical protein BDC45DRAFT_496408 [Circinella umbellata]|nr:hypothetical protein BDC45DRAFT_496408 [Circinella umbellata]
MDEFRFLTVYFFLLSLSQLSVYLFLEPNNKFILLTLLLLLLLQEKKQKQRTFFFLFLYFFLPFFFFGYLTSAFSFLYTFIIPC